MVDVVLSVLLVGETLKELLGGGDMGGEHSSVVEMQKEEKVLRPHKEDILM